MSRFRPTPLMVLVAALLPVGLALMAPRAASADTAVTLDGTWYFHDQIEAYGERLQPFTFTSVANVEITVTDTLCMGDVYEVFDNNVSLGTTSPVGLNCDSPAFDPDDAIAAGFSSGVFTVGPGSHSIHIVPVQQVSSGDAWQYYIKFEMSGSIRPHWEVRATIGGGNIYNAFLPDYEPGTWSTKNVGVYLFCIPGDAPIDLLRADRSVIFKDGTHTYSTKPTDICIDENGLAAEPIVEWGPIMVDTKAPTCKFTPGTIYVPRNATTPVVFAWNVSDATSGIWSLANDFSTFGGADYNQATFWAGGTFEANVIMGTSTAGRFEVTVTAIDNAGNSSACKAVVRAR
jgi:hypothetical protein